ncbi:unnamed protein product [Phyllotreta striolata]|uniref:Uncharacterized protein n=1 Tax=Phyllotreta striolata TaxID=444603 RepID=A0A9N9TEU3_PHYSR|nr:unnamed protein product [Phyllotreta striolata]
MKPKLKVPEKPVPNPKLLKIKKMQKIYQSNEGEPVWRKTPNDILLYKISLAGVAIGLAMGLYTVIWELSIKKRFFPD